MMIYTAATRLTLLSLIRPLRISVFPEVSALGIPESPHGTMRMVDHLVRNDISFATLSEVAICRVQHLVKYRKLDAIPTIIFRDRKGRDHAIRLDVKGEFIDMWPDESPLNIFEATFRLRYSETFIDLNNPLPSGLLP